jgi:hypothetical protein
MCKLFKISFQYPSAKDIPDPQERGIQKEKVTYALRVLKEAELHLRHEQADLLVGLPSNCRDMLETARKTPLVVKYSHEIPELPFVFAELSKLFELMHVNLMACIHGPYLLDLADPLAKVVIEWDANWHLYPPYRQMAQEKFTRRKHRMLQHEGWKVLTMPLADFHALEGRENKVEYLGRFLSSHDLDYLRQDD